MTQHRREAVCPQQGRCCIASGRSEAVRRFPTHGTAPTSTWRGVRMRSFVAGGGLAARFAGSAAGAAFEEPSPEEALEVSGEEAVYDLFGSLRASLLRMIGLPMQGGRQREWKLRNAQKQQMEAAGKRVPADFCPPSQVFFFMFQFDRTSMLASSPMWNWMDGR
jgi:hypothetical protein